MTIANMAELVRHWFEQAKQASGPVLPDGWFGNRPYENLYFLVQVDVLNNTQLIIRMSGNFSMREDTSISITRPGNLSVKNSELVFGDFEEATFRWREYGGTEYREQKYISGEIRLVPPVG